MLEKGKKFLNICLSTFLLLSIIFLFSVQNVKAEEETDTINPDEIQMSVDSLLTGISSKGFHPSKRNYLSIRAGVSFNTEQDLEGTAINVRLRILNKSGKYVYEKTYKNIGGTNFWGDPVTSFEHKTIRSFHHNSRIHRSRYCRLHGRKNDPVSQNKAHYEPG